MRYWKMVLLSVLTVLLLLGCWHVQQPTSKSSAASRDILMRLTKSTRLFVRTDGSVWLVEDTGIVRKSPTATVRRYVVRGIVP